MEQKDLLNLSEEDTKRLFITRALENKGWKNNSILMEVTLPNSSEKADYVLYDSNGQPIAVLEAKKYKCPDSEGIQQAKNYAKQIGVHFAFSSSGKGFRKEVFYKDKYYATDLRIEEFPTQSRLMQELENLIRSNTPEIKNTNIDIHKYLSWVNDKYEPRYYQIKAVNKVLDAIADGQKRILLVMATGTGKTFVARKIIETVNKFKPNSRILFLCDRDAIANQTVKEFQSFKSKLIRIGVDKNNKYDKAAEIYISLYHQLAPREDVNPLLNYKKDFFDYIVVDECHRGSSDENSEWRNILEYFVDATQIGLTATPKESEDVSNRLYFGDPVYMYSLKEGIQDGYLAPYKIFQIEMDDLEQASEMVGKLDEFGREIDYAPEAKHIDKFFYYQKRTERIAQRITSHLQEFGPYNKTIVFCKNDEHALRMRNALIKYNPEMMAKAQTEGKDYIVRITSDDKEGKSQLEAFCDPHEKYPVIATTAELLTTGVDTKTLKLIVLDTEIMSIIKLQQIIGRGTRIYTYQDEDRDLEAFQDKTHFFVFDFYKSTDKLDDDIWGLPDIKIKIKESTERSTEIHRLITDTNKLYIKGPRVSIINETKYSINNDLKLVAEINPKTAKEKILGLYKTKEEFNKAFLSLDIAEKPFFVNNLLKQLNINLKDIKNDLEDIDKNINDFDFISFLAYGIKPNSKQTNVNLIKSSFLFANLKNKQKEIINILLDKYLQNGYDALINLETLEVYPLFEYGGMKKIIELFGGRDKYNQLINNLLKLII
ncbi:DEAD/DEAH box helicase [[Mycoplasma] falconis]|uniref:DEAD/DEAH box helicase n=1 Tax=[Mycoplasma] falconis TaxID=92403 RepID=A0A501X8R4_9BACT|nr:type I restriction endonuclease subunit R [[Mycoplasma] falconis]TPE56767.1 DEAD/DEAH box helicase [[Mycoplasma] falconis]